MNSKVWAGALLSSFVWLGCTCGSGTPPEPREGIDLDGLISIALEPADQVVVSDGLTPAALDFTVIGTYQDGHTAELSAVSRFSVLDVGLGDFARNRYRTPTARGGKSLVRADVAGLHAETSVTVIIRRSAADPASVGLPTDPGSKFTAPEDPSRAPELVYPNDGVVVPPNLGKLEFHFLPNGNTLFELAFTNALTAVRVHLACSTPINGGCVYLPDPAVWKWITETNRGGEPVTVTLRGTDEVGTAVGTSEPLSISFAPENLEGGLYYWTTSNGTGIMRFDFASSSQVKGERFLGIELTGGTCVGCHALSRDGKKIVAEAGGQNDGRIILLDVGRVTPLVPFAQPGKSTFESWSPDGSQYVGVYADTGATNFNLMLFNGETGAYDTAIPNTGTAAQPANHPDWSADGSRIAYTRVGIKGTLQRMFKGSIQMVTRAGTTWSAPETLVPAVDGKNRYFPAFSPDGELVVYDESTCPTGLLQHKDCNGDTDPSAQLYIVRSSVGNTPVALERANGPGKTDGDAQALTNSFPKWSPFTSRGVGGPASRLQWVTFSSTRNYGLRAPPPGGSQNPKGTLIWMAAIDPDRMDKGLDPSFPALALPFQDLETSNHIAQWATVVVPTIN